MAKLNDLDMRPRCPNCDGDKMAFELKTFGYDDGAGGHIEKRETYDLAAKLFTVRTLICIDCGYIGSGQDFVVESDRDEQANVDAAFWLGRDDEL